jgi:hypothetical protein
VKVRSGIGTETDDVPGIGSDFWMNENDMHN